MPFQRPRSISTTLISAFEHYNDTRGVIRKFLNKKQYIKRVIEALDEQQVLIENELDHVLKLAGFGDEADSISLTSYQTLLLRQDVADGLQTVLGRSYDAYIRAINRCGMSVLEIARRLKGLMDAEDFTIESLAEHAKKSQQSNGKFEFRSRLRVSLDVDGLESKLKELDESTNMMSRLRISGQAVEGHEPVSSKAHKRMMHVLEKIRKDAGLMYSALCQSWSTGCHGGHSTNLYLQASAVHLEKKSTLHFQVCFRAMEAGSGAEMLLLEKLVVVQRLEISPQLPPKGSKVNFANITRPQMLPDPQSLSEVKDLCSHLTQAQSQDKSLLLYLSETPSLLCTIEDCSYTGPFNTAAMSHPLITLDGVLDHFSRTSRIDRAQFWNISQRMYLAATLASSMLQLCNTPWLAHSWSRYNVFFHTYTRTNPKTGTIFTGFEAKHPFLVQRFHGKAMSAKQTNQNANECILELGVLLLEIFDGRSTESWAQEMHLAFEKTAESRCHVAGQWLEYRAPDMLPKYRGAVASCVDIASSKLQPVRTWLDPELQKTLLETVVQPLVTACM
ncbi:hypothetical protein FGG08_007534 [Glutinoglossum americanum]|uniref:DUF7580 domain-containing protein n=1 Tax=Glutinoglossum americanum TaxID=1670608 RepID=A0A9P8HTP7_9PEZI|nr:hypothetical protein FGG08_007534 [Glutinoglossum americanum]